MIYTDKRKVIFLSQQKKCLKRIKTILKTFFVDLGKKIGKSNKEKIKWFYINKISWKYLELI